MDHSTHIGQIRSLPELAREAVAGLSTEQLNTPYRDGGWTPNQIIHHLADSHMHAYLRTKFILTEDHPTLKPYDQDTWAKLPDAKTHDVNTSLAILDGMHNRWAALYESLTDDQWKRAAFHPERGKITVLDMLNMYSEHGLNHVAQIKQLRKAKGW